MDSARRHTSSMVLVFLTGLLACNARKAGKEAVPTTTV